MNLRTQKPVPVNKLTEAMFRANPVWEFCNDDEVDETLVKPVEKIPITSSVGRLVGCDLRLADGSTLFGFIGNLELVKEDRNQHYLTLSLFLNGSIEHLARYHDIDFVEGGPASLAKKIGKKEVDVFPISYDVSACVIGSNYCIRGSIEKEPKQKLSRSEIIMLAVE